MRVRTWTALVAVLGLLLHAEALARHRGIMLATHLLKQALASDASFCQGDANAWSPRGAPGKPKPADSQSGCPVCTGQAPTCAVVAFEHLTIPLHFAVMARWSEPERINPALRHAVCPPPRGPPASALPA
jgi:hypothetical protein